MKVLITGDVGYIGTHLKRELKDHGYEIVGHDRAEGDLTFDGVFARSLRRAKPDMVVHLAAQYGRVFCDDNLHRAVQSNALLTTYVARDCGLAGVPLVATSTSEVYGDYGNQVCFEDTPLTGPASGMYALSKRWSEEAARHYAPNGLRIIRPTMPYGPGTFPGRGRMAILNFLWWAHTRQPIIVHRGAERSWCHVSDVVRGVRMVMEGPPGVYNVGRDHPRIKMVDLARMCCDLTDAPRSLIQVVTPPEHQTVVKRTSTARLEALGWRPLVELEDGLPELYEWLKDQDCADAA